MGSTPLLGLGAGEGKCTKPIMVQYNTFAKPIQMPDKIFSPPPESMDMLAKGHNIETGTGHALTKKEKKEILAAIAEYETNPSSGIKWCELKSELIKKYKL